MELTRLSSKGQLVIPGKMRKDLGIDENSTIAVEEVDGAIVVKKVDDEVYDKIKKSLEDIKHGRIKEWKD
ncbi:MAG: AbrB/MazE/SpoVT family DNA-binding domain-containing protein [Candidatus Pacearchaeota archaeon]